MKRLAMVLAASLLASQVVSAHDFRSFHDRHVHGGWWDRGQAYGYSPPPPPQEYAPPPPSPEEIAKAIADEKVCAPVHLMGDVSYYHAAMGCLP